MCIVMESSANTRISLLDRARHRDPVAWRELVDLYGPLVASWCHKCLDDSHAVADCIQDVFASVSVSLDSFQPQYKVGSFRAWLWTVTRNKIRDHSRRVDRHVAGTGGSTMLGVIQDFPDASIPTDEPTDSFELKELTQRALNQVQAEFEARTWQAFWRTVVDGITTSVVAEELGVTAATVRQHRSRVLRRLRQQLGDVG
ncbi:MAG: RNA polymerase sigma factor [Planctomycetaceae bacterium]